MGTVEEARTKITYKDEDVFDVVYQFTHPVKDVRKLVNKGADFYHETAMAEIGDEFSLLDIGPLIEGFQKIVLGSTSTMVQHEVPESTSVDDKGKEKTVAADFFVEPRVLGGVSNTSVS